jgi:type I restriction enzyme, S subunit
MKLDTFFDDFGLLADAPNSVQKLREMILQLAVQGKLVPHDPKDEPASVLLEKIKAEKKRLIKEKKIAKPKQLPPIKPDEVLYKLPDGWEWTRLADMGLINPRNEISDETEVSFVPMKLVPTVIGDRVESEIRQWGDIKKGFTHFSEGDVALAKITPCFQNRKSAVMRRLKNGSGAGTTELHIFRSINDLIISEYVLLYLKTPNFIREGVSKMTGSAGQKRVPKTYFSETPFPLPPKNEQKRIVTKVDELMDLCDELEARKQQISNSCIQLNHASIHKLLSPYEPKKFSKHWQRICDNFDLLYSKPENVVKLRQAILQLAVQGTLVPQDPKDEPASVLLKKIKAEKERLVKEGKLRKTKTLPPIKSDEIPYELPKTWVWIRLGNLIRVSSGNALPKHKMIDGNIPVYGGNGITGYHNQYNVSKKTIVIGRVGFYCGSIHLTPYKAWVTDNAFITYYPEHSIDLNFLIWLLRATNLQHNTSATAQPVISGGKIYPLLVPLPPNNEQKRIVAKVDLLMALCDELETSLSKSQTKCDRLMVAAVAEILAA